MSFERTKQSIENLNGSSITAEAMLDMLIRTTRDVYENNGVKGANDLQVADGRQLAIKMNNLMNLLNRLYANHSAALSKVTAETREDLQNAAGKLQEAEQTVSALDADITKAEAEQKKLTAENEKVTKKRGHLKTVKADCDALQKEIDTLNDPHLDELAAKKTNLEADRDARKTKSDGLQKNIAVLNQEIGELKTSVEADEKKLTELKNEKKRLDGLLEDVSKQIEDAKTAIENHDKREAELNGSLDEQKARLAECEARFAVIQSAWNSAAKDAFLQGNLLNGRDGLAAEEETVENFEQLEDWFAKTGERIEGLLQVYGAMLRSTVERAKQLTAEQEE